MIITNKRELITNLTSKKIGIIPTDTIYGLVCHYQNWSGIKKILAIKNRSSQKPFPLLVASLAQLAIFVHLTPAICQYLTNLSSPTTVIFPAKLPTKNFFSPSDQTIAIRLVQWKWLQRLILITGPLFATSCNSSGAPPFTSKEQLFSLSDQIDFIFPKSTLSFTPSAIWDWKNQKKIR